MGWIDLAKTGGAVAVAALLAVGCTMSTEDETQGTVAEAGVSGTTDGAPAAEPAAPAVSYAGSWVQTDDPDPSFLTLQEGGRVTHNEATLPEGRWHATANGGVEITFSGQQSVTISGAMQGDTLVLTLPDGETGRFVRSSASGASQASNGGQPQYGPGQQGGQPQQFGQGGGNGAPHQFGQGY